MELIRNSYSRMTALVDKPLYSNFYPKCCIRIKETHKITIDLFVAEWQYLPFTRDKVHKKILHMGFKNHRIS